MKDKTHNKCGECGYFMRYADWQKISGDCASIGMNKECYEGVNPFVNDYTPILQVEEYEDACGFFRTTRTPRVKKLIKAQPKLYKQLTTKKRN